MTTITENTFWMTFSFWCCAAVLQFFILCISSFFLLPCIFIKWSWRNHSSVMFLPPEAGKNLSDQALWISFSWCFTPFYSTCPSALQVNLILACIIFQECPMHSNLDYPLQPSKPHLWSVTSFLCEDKILWGIPQVFATMIWYTYNHYHEVTGCNV